MTILLHIVRSGETLVKIADAYHCEISDITSNNLHITDFKNLLPGTKLRIPFLSKETMEILEETESFISDYYPTFNGVGNVGKTVVEKDEIYKETKDEKIEEKPEQKVVEKTCEECKINKTNNSVPTPKFNSNYFGNVIPNIPPNFIRKI